MLSRTISSYPGALPRHSESFAENALQLSDDPGSPCGVQDNACAAYFAVQPPSIEKLLPVIWLAESEHKKTASAAT
jgi:hypothetical protein